MLWAMVLMVVVAIDKLMEHQNYSDDMEIKKLMNMMMDVCQHSVNVLFPDEVYQIFDEELTKHSNSVEHNIVDQLVNTIVHHQYV